MTSKFDPGLLSQRLFRGELAVSSEERDVLLYLVYNPESERRSLQYMAKSLRMSKNTVLAAVASLEERNYLDRTVIAEPGKRKRTEYLLLQHPDLGFEDSMQLVPMRTDEPSQSVPEKTDAPGAENQPVDRRGSAGNPFQGRAEFIEAAREIEWLFKGKGGYVPFRQLNDAVEELIRERGTQEYRQFSNWLSTGPWRSLSIAALPALIHRWDEEKRSLLQGGGR